MDSFSPVDGIIVLALLWIARRMLATPALFSAVVLFIVFGLLMALAWVRLGAVDIALAEAAIGAGLTGVLLLDTAAHLEVRRRDVRRRAVAAALRVTVGLLAFALVAALIGGVLTLAPGRGDLAVLVAAGLSESGVRHDVTAVLLNFRAYDTLLEIAVLLVAALGVLVLRGARAVPTPESASVMLAALTTAVVPVMILVAGYLLWAGSHRPGGAFQAGAVLAAAAVLLRLTGRVSAVVEAATWLRLGLALGLGVFLAVGLGTLPRALLAYPPDWAGTLVLIIESALTLSIALTLFTVFAAAPPERTRAGGS